MLYNRKIHVLLIEDEEYDVRRVQNTLKPFAERIILRDITSDGHSALELLQAHKGQYEVVIMDFQIAGSLTGEELILRMKAVDPALQIIVITKRTINITDFDFANRLLEAGAMWYCTKYPGDIEAYIYQPTDFILSIFNAAEKRRLELEQQRSNRKLSQNVEDILREKRIIGESEVVQKLKQQIAMCANNDAIVLIRGLSGTGKELVAANIHYQSRRRLEKFVAINCGSLPQDLIESELFGFEKGAFTGAQERKKGLFEIADNGTLFLDEIAEMPLSAQVKLLRVIQEGEIDKIGRTEKVKVNVRVIAATNKHIEEEVRAKRFREDLYYRLNVVSIWLQPLRERRQDILLLAQHFMQKFSADMGRETPHLSETAREVLLRYEWPGNVRELQNVVQRLLFTGERELGRSEVEIALGWLHRDRAAKDPNGIDFTNPDKILPLREVEKRFREKYFRFVRDHAGSDAEAARLLGLAPPNYHRMCKELGLK